MKPCKTSKKGKLEGAERLFVGIVSTTLSEEELSKCLKISIYEPLQIKESKCSICQEEFIAGDEIGRMGCNHGYHVVCVNQWLQLKNWCPVCKFAFGVLILKTMLIFWYCLAGFCSHIESQGPEKEGCSREIWDHISNTQKRRFLGT
ncbi:unnamed protein product [Lactuca virosa]|uniref:RING-type E3 ubiquitin transferase n=1 Tax=Lactuca virosa TaxID=75947 RepID=A0AAU9NBA6_9ASTR|nr:unnamed protein product [Lactuca virosa]